MSKSWCLDASDLWTGEVVEVMKYCIQMINLSFSRSFCEGLKEQVGPKANYCSLMNHRTHKIFRNPGVCAVDLCVCLALILSLCLQRTALFLGGFSVTGQYFTCSAAGVGHPHTQTCRWTEREMRIDKACTGEPPEVSHQISLSSIFQE